MGELKNAEEVLQEVLSQRLIDVNLFMEELVYCNGLGRRSLEAVIQLLNKQPVIEHRMFGRDELGRCKLRGCNLCDTRKEQLQKRWVPCNVRLPDTDGRYEVTIKNKRGKRHVEMCEYHKNKHGVGKWERRNVTAWRQRAEPYKED